MNKLKMCVTLLLPIYLLASDCYETTLMEPRPFKGNNGEIFKLLDGTIGEIKYEYEYMYEYQPDVIICPDKNKMVVNGKNLNIQIHVKSKNTSKNVNSSSGTLESTIFGEFKGFEGDTIIKLANGQIWQQTEYFYEYYYAYSPKILIYQSNGIFKMKVDGISKPVGVTRLK